MKAARSWKVTSNNMLNPFKVFGAGLSAWGSYVKNHQKQILLWTVFAPLGFVTFCVVTVALAYGLFKGIFWLALHTPKSVNDFINVHHVGVAYSMMGFMLLFGICHALYQDGKKKLQNDKVSGI
jgi:hypothetical protein